MTQIEKKMLIVTAALIITTIALVTTVSNEIDNAGGIKQIIINAGKEIKDISKEIDKE